MATFGFGAQPQASAFGGINFAASTSTSAPSMASTSLPTFGTSNIGTATPFGGATTTTTPSLFGSKVASTTAGPSPFSSSLFPSSTTSFPTLGQASTATTGGFSFGGFGAATNTAFGTGTSLVPSSGTQTSAAPSFVGLGGVDIQTSAGLNGVNANAKKDGKAIKESQIPNEIAVTVESFKKYVKEQKAIREEMSRISSKNIFWIQEQVAALKQQLSIVSNGLQRNVIAISKLKEESNQELKNAEIAQRVKDTPSFHYENNAPTEYFHNLANSFERQMLTYRQQIEQLERHLLSFSQPYTLTPNEWTMIRQRLHDTFVTLAAQLHTVHQAIQVYKEELISNFNLNQGDAKALFDNHKDFTKESLFTSVPTTVTYGPSPFAMMQSAVGKAITNVFNQPQQLPGKNNTGTNGSSLFSLSMSRTMCLQTAAPFKTLGQGGLAPLGGSTFGDAASFSSDGATQTQFGQKPFQLQKPPSGNKRGKRWTST